MLMDEYQDPIAASKQEAQVDFFNRNYKPGNILDIGCGSGTQFEWFPVTHAIEPNPARMKKAEARDNVIVMQGWAENLPYQDMFFDTVTWHSGFYFARSRLEALSEINRVLKIKGSFIFEITTWTTFPIIDTVDEESFIHYIRNCGFEILERRKSPYSTGWQHEVMFAVEKTRDFNWRYFCMPHVPGKIRNFLEERDWYMTPEDK
jgi:ubiquinone/menaquinone biosynthesis C-methylase UbiE